MSLGHLGEIFLFIIILTAACIHTYIIGHYNPSVRITTKPLTPLMLCALILYMTPNNSSLRSFLMPIVFTFSVLVKNLLRGSRRRNIFIFSFRCLTWGLNLGLTSNKSTHYLLDYGKPIEPTQCTASSYNYQEEPLTIFNASLISNFLNFLWKALCGVM